jgi:hypothetical protein
VHGRGGARTRGARRGHAASGSVRVSVTTSLRPIPLAPGPNRTNRAGLRSRRPAP